MAGATSEVNLKIKLDKKDASAGILDFTKDINTSIKGIVSSYGAVAVAAAAVGVAIVKAFDAAKEIAQLADETNKVNKQFDFLAANVGASSKGLREAFAEANQGIEDTEEILKKASVALVNLQIPAENVGKNFEAARKLAVGLGADSTEAFDAINTAIASGNTRALKQVGIFLDAGDAVEKYAQSLGLASKFLTDAQKQTALFEAIQEKVNQSFGDVDIKTKTTSETFKAFGTAIDDVGEAVAIGLNKMFGPSVQALLGKFTEGLAYLANQIMAQVGSETEQAAAKQEIFNSKLEDEVATLEKLRKIQEESRGSSISGINSRVAAQEKLVAKLREQQEQEDVLAMKQAQASGVIEEFSKKNVQLTDDQIKKNKELAQARSEFISKTVASESQLTQQIIQRSTDTLEIEQAFQDRRTQIQQEADLKIVESQKQAAQLGLANTQALADQEKAIRDQARLNEEIAQAEFNQRMVEARTQQALIDGELSVAGGAKTLAFQKQIIDAQIAQAQRGSEEEKRLKIKSLELEKQIADAKVAATSQALGNLSSLMQTNSRELFEIGKAAAIADATLRAYQAFNLALATLPPPFGAIVGGTSLAAGLVQVSKIASTNLATGLTKVPPGFPNDTFSANLTSGERVVNVQQNKDLTEFLNRQESGSFGEETNSLLEGILNRLSNLENTIVVNVGNKEIVREVREGLRAGRTLAV